MDQGNMGRGELWSESTGAKKSECLPILSVIFILRGVEKEVVAI